MFNPTLSYLNFKILSKVQLSAILETNIKYMEQVTLIMNDTLETYLTRANQLRQKGKLDEAIASYQKAIKLQPKQSTWFYKGLGDALNQNGQLDIIVAC